ncbi:MAG: head morphogenesis protein [Deltaproteobacteria bacterium]|nr:head morphogenesis protein [Deltaproteobacteria bacterium]
MCDQCNTADRLAMIQAARIAADEIAGRYLRLRLHKVYDLGDSNGFDRAVSNLAGLLRAKVSDTDEDAVRAAVGVLDVNWSSTTAAQRRDLISRALTAAGRKTAAIPAKIQVVFDDAADEVVRATRTMARRDQKLAISADFNSMDKRVIKHLKKSQSNFVSDEYGRRHEVFGMEARRIVSDGLESGLGRDDIARNLQKAAKKTLASKGSPYWDVVAGAFVGRGRSFAQLSAYHEARIDRYLFEAVLDEVTTDTCRFFHGKAFSVDRGIKLFEAVEENPDDIKNLNPWVRTGKNDSGEKVLYVSKNDQRIPIATVASSSVGTRDEIGSFRGGRSEQELMDLGISFPPLHGLCRSTTTSLGV